MRLEWLEDILAIAETGSFSGAAERRRLTQSAFSRRVQQIEDYVGVELFDRDYKPIRLKPTTVAQKEQIIALAAGLRQLSVDLRRGERLSSNRVVVACQHSLTTTQAPALLRKLPSERDGIHVRLRSANLDECAGLLMSRQVDVAIVYRMPDELNEFVAGFIEEITIGTDRLIPVFNAQFSTFSADEAGGIEFPCVSYPSDVYLGQVMERRVLPLLRPDLHQIPKVETSLTLAAVEMAAMGIGIAWVPESLALSRILAGDLVDLSPVLPKAELQIRAMRLQGKPNCAEGAFWAMLRSLG